MGLCVLAATGCKQPEATRDMEFELQKAEQEREAYQQRLAAEQAKTAALERRMETEEGRWTANRAEAVRLRASLKQCEQRYEELEGVVKEFREQTLTRPEVSVSPLPEAIDQALLGYAEELSDRVWYARTRGAISFANDRLFELGSATVRSDAIASLHELADILKQVPPDQYEIIIVGHTDAAPISKPETKQEHPTNWHLSVHRAIAVEQVLGEAGVPPEQMGVMGYGPYRPVATDPARNRRVEVFIVRKGAVQAMEPVKH
jgi:chemotaxis protein MotB